MFNPPQIERHTKENIEFFDNTKARKTNNNKNSYKKIKNVYGKIDKFTS